MKERMKTIWALFCLSLVSCFLFTSLSFGQEMPKPGQVIDKSNYKKYAHLFPEEGWLEGFENGWGGLTKPLSLQVSETTPAGQCKAFLALSEKNRGKYTIDKDGLIAGGYDYLGLPFPGITKDDKDFAIKLMWNWAYRYVREDRISPIIYYGKRRGESPILNANTETSLNFINRLYEQPKPIYKNPPNLQNAMILHYSQPISNKDFMLLAYRYMDPKKTDDTYLYLPTLRRVLRGEAGQRSTPTAGSPAALDDYHGFDGKTFEFNYKFIREQKVLGCVDSTAGVERAMKEFKELGGKVAPFPSENWSVRDVYVIEITPKDTKYPQSKKIAYIDKDAIQCLYSVAYDRSGKLWKVFETAAKTFKMPDGDTQTYEVANLALDLQFGMVSDYESTVTKLFGFGVKYSDVMPSALLRMAR